MKNKYDKDYDDSVERLTIEDYNPYSLYVDEILPEVLSFKARNSSKSKLCKETQYTQFLKNLSDLKSDNGTVRAYQKNSLELISVKWVTGGVTGGSCWGGNPDTYISSEEPEELEELDLILKTYVPHITYFEYKDLVKNVIKKDSYTKNEYYGNSTNYAVEYCLLSDLYIYFLNKGWIK